MPDAADAQGRFGRLPSTALPSEATAIEFLREFDRLLTGGTRGKTG